MAVVCHLAEVEDVLTLSSRSDRVQANRFIMFNLGGSGDVPMRETTGT
jgi:hypothetical protein